MHFDQPELPNSAQLKKTLKNDKIRAWFGYLGTDYGFPNFECEFREEDRMLSSKKGGKENYKELVYPNNQEIST